MSEKPKIPNPEFLLRKNCTDGTMEEGAIGKMRIRKISTAEDDATDEKRKWPKLCDTNPYIVDFFKNLFKKEEPPPPPPPEQTS